MPVGQFALVFSVAYAALKWNYIFPVLWKSDKQFQKKENSELNFQNWIFAISGIGVAVLQNISNIPKIKTETSFLMGIVSLLAVILPNSNAWMASATAIHLELINIIVRGKRNEKIVAGVVYFVVTLATAINAKKSVAKVLVDYLKLLAKKK